MSGGGLIQRWGTMLSVWLALHGSALAQGVDGPWPTWSSVPLGGRTATMGGAGVAQGWDAAMPLLNPAGLAQVNQARISMSASAYVLHAVDVSGFFTSGEGSEIGDLEGVVQSDPTDYMHSQITDAYPTSFVYSWVLGQPAGQPGHHVISLSILTPRRDLTRYTGLFAVDLNGARSTSELSLAQDATTYAFGPTWAMQLNDRLRIGLGLQPLYQPTFRQFSSTSRTYAGAERSFNQGQNTSRGWSLDVIATAGVQLQATDWLHLGLSISSPSMHLAGYSETQFTTNRTSSLGLIADQIASPDEFVTGRLESDRYELRQPIMVAGGVAIGRPGRWLLAVDARYIGGLKYTRLEGTRTTEIRRDNGGGEITTESVSLQTNVDRVVNLNAGAEFFVAEDLALRFGGYIDLSPVRPLEPSDEPEHLFSRRINLVGLTAGLGFQFGPADFTIGALYSGGEGDIGAFFNQVAQVPGGQYQVGTAEESRLSAIITGGVTFGEAVAPLGRGVQSAVETAQALLTAQPPAALTVKDLDPALAKLDKEARKALAEAAITFERFGLKQVDAFFKAAARLEGAAVIARHSLFRLRDGLQRVRRQVVNGRLKIPGIDGQKTLAQVWLALVAAERAGLTGDAAQAFKAIRADARRARLALKATLDGAQAVVKQGQALVKGIKKRLEGSSPDVAIAVSAALRQGVVVARRASKHLAQLAKTRARLIGQELVR